MADAWKDLGARLKDLGASWTAYTVLASFALYLLGYLALRFYLTFLGAGTDLAVLDERYFYAGAQFAVYLVSSVPTVLLVAMALAACLALPYRLLPAPARAAIGDGLRRRAARLAHWGASTPRVGIAGILFSVIMIQFVMRHPFLFPNLLVAERLPEHAWLSPLLVSDSEGLRALYFAGLVVATGISVGIWLLLGGREMRGGLDRFLRGLLAFLAAVQLLVLPVNYALLLTANAMPRVTGLGKEPLPAGQTAWLIWEGKEGVTYLLRGTRDGRERRSLVTLARKDIDRIEITAYDPVLRLLFAPPAAPARGGPAPARR